MKKNLLLLLGTALLLSGWLSAFFLNSVPQHNSLYIIGPTLLLGCGMGLMHKIAGWKLTAITLVFTALTALLSMNQLLPERSISISAFQQRLQDNRKAASHQVAIVTRAADRKDMFVADRTLKSSADINIRLFARLPGPVGMMTFDSAGTLYVSIPKLGAIYQLKDTDKDGYAEQPVLYHVGMDRPSGLLWDSDKLYVAEPSRLLELQDTTQDNQVDKVRVVLAGWPDEGGHWRRSMSRGNDGSLYLSIGSRCNACEEKDPRYATILRVNPYNGESSIFARGLRDTVSLAFAPDGKSLWGTDIGRDGLGDKLPPDEINRIVAGGNYGWPFCYGQKIPDVSFGSVKLCAKTIASVIDLPAHSMPMGITFGAGLNAPEKYRNSLYVVLPGEEGSQIFPHTGGKVIRIPFKNNHLLKQSETFLTGWQVAGHFWGDPVAVAVGTDGNLYLGDEGARVIYQISWKYLKK